MRQWIFAVVSFAFATSLYAAPIDQPRPPIDRQTAYRRFVFKTLFNVEKVQNRLALNAAGQHHIAAIRVRGVTNQASVRGTRAMRVIARARVKLIPRDILATDVLERARSSEKLVNAFRDVEAAIESALTWQPAERNSTTSPRQRLMFQVLKPNLFSPNPNGQYGELLIQLRQLIGGEDRSVTLD